MSNKNVQFEKLRKKVSLVIGTLAASVNQRTSLKFTDLTSCLRFSLPTARPMPALTFNPHLLVNGMAAIFGHGGSADILTPGSGKAHVDASAGMADISNLSNCAFAYGNSSSFISTFVFSTGSNNAGELSP